MNKNNPFLTPGVWYNKRYKCETLDSLDKNLFIKFTKLFWNDVMSKLNENQYVLLTIRIKYETEGYATLTSIQKVNMNDYKEFIEVVVNSLEIKSEYYFHSIAELIIFSYKIIPAEKLSIMRSKIIKPAKTREASHTTKLRGYNFPNSSDLDLFGDRIATFDNKVIIRKRNSSLNYIAEKFDGHNLVKLYKDNKLLLTFTDFIGENLDSFKRVINNQTYYFKNGALIFKMYHHKCNFLTGIQEDKKLVQKFLTLDIETQNKGSQLIPYCISFYDGKMSRSYYLTDYTNYEDMIIHALTSILTSKYHGYSVYIHNFSSFDGVFMLRLLSRLDNVKLKIMKRENQLINIKIIYKDKYVINLRDSLLLLPLSLAKLAISFKVQQKSLFPYKFVDSNLNETLDLNYKGAVPDIKYFDSVSNELYQEYFSRFNDLEWSLRKETIKYCEDDCVVLYQVIEKFNNFIFRSFKININRFPTLPSLTFGIFRANFLKEDITILNSNFDEFVRKGYIGGATDYFQLYAKFVYYYDVNSLYPYVMKMTLPNKPIKKYNDMSNIKLENFFGFVLTEIHCPDSITIPLWPYKDPNTNRTIHPKGTWQGVYYSEELKAVSKLGYKIKLIEGIEFSKSNPFNDYIDHFYDLKKNSIGGTRFIAKMQLNQLYGIFGRKQELIRSVNTNDITKYAHYQIKAIIDSGSEWSTLLLVDRKYIDQTVTNISDLFEQNNDHKIVKSNVAIAAAVTANARIIMNIYKLAAGDSLLYTDTDSIFTTKPLDPELIGKALGMMKDELNGKIIDEAYFFGIKKYGYRIDSEAFSVFAGIKRNSLTWQNIVDINNNKTVESLQNNVFFKSLSSLNIEIKNRNIKIVKNSCNIKTLVNNRYLPPVIKQQ